MRALAPEVSSRGIPFETGPFSAASSAPAGTSTSPRHLCGTAPVRPAQIRNAACPISRRENAKIAQGVVRICGVPSDRSSSLGWLGGRNPGNGVPKKPRAVGALRNPIKHPVAPSFRSAEAGPSTPLKCASLRMTGVSARPKVLGATLRIMSRSRIRSFAPG
jgi:hypothetical protein